MYQNYNYYPQQTQQQPATYARQTQASGLKGRPVSSLDEVRASTVDFDGSIFYFPDLANKRIYTKQINMDGTASLNMYELKEMPTEQQGQSLSYITREEFDRVIAQLRASMAETQPQSAQTLVDAQPAPAKKKEDIRLQF